MHRTSEPAKGKASSVKSLHSEVSFKRCIEVQQAKYDTVAIGNVEMCGLCWNLWDFWLEDTLFEEEWLELQLEKKWKRDSRQDNILNAKINMWLNLGSRISQIFSREINQIHILENSKCTMENKSEEVKKFVCGVGIGLDAKIRVKPLFLLKQ